MFAFIIFGGACAWYLLYRNCYSNQTDNSDLLNDDLNYVNPLNNIGLNLHMSKKNIEGEKEGEDKINQPNKLTLCEQDNIPCECKINNVNRVASVFTANNIVNEAIQNVIEKMADKREHIDKLEKVHEELDDQYPKYIFNKAMNELEQKVKNYTDEESDGFTSDEWDDLLAGRKANFNSRLIYSDENLNINDIGNWFDSQGNENLLSYKELISMNGNFIVRRINQDDGNYYFLLYQIPSEEQVE